MPNPAMSETAAIRRSLVLSMATACGIGVAAIYYNQPMLGLIGHDFSGGFLTKLIPTSTQLGYAAGLFFLVPLGDLMERRRVIVVQFLFLAAALALAAVAPSAGLLNLASFLIGMGATVAQQIVPFAATLSDDKSRGSTIGAVMAGLLGGILLSQVLAGFVATHAGWRAMFWLAIPLALAGCALMAAKLPKAPSAIAFDFPAALKSLVTLWTALPALRRAMLVQAGLFATFCAFWAVLALHMQTHYRLGPDVVGLFGLIGIMGVLAAPLAGRLADTRGPQVGVRLGAVVTAVSWVVMGVWNGLGGLVLGVVLLNFGVQTALVCHQHIIYALDETARSRLNTVFMTGMFLGGSLGSVGAPLAWSAAGWIGVCLWSGGLTLCSLLLLAVASRRG